MPPILCRVACRMLLEAVGSADKEIIEEFGSLDMLGRYNKTGVMALTEAQRDREFSTHGAMLYNTLRSSTVPAGGASSAAVPCAFSSFATVVCVNGRRGCLFALTNGIAGSETPNPGEGTAGTAATTEKATAPTAVSLHPTVVEDAGASLLLSGRLPCAP